MIERQTIARKGRTSVFLLGAIAVADSRNGKTANYAARRERCAATYAPITETCPAHCTFREPGPNGETPPCYARHGKVAMVARRCDESAPGAGALAQAYAEADAIDALRVYASRPLRIHVAGDSCTVEGTRAIAEAAARYIDSGGGQVWGYTRGWRDVPRSAWGRVNIFASLEHPREAVQAIARGYAVAAVVDEFAPTNGRAYKIDGSPVAWVPCPALVDDTPDGPSCVSCKLCHASDARRDAGRGILFSAHSGGAREGKRRLALLA